MVVELKQWSQAELYEDDDRAGRWSRHAPQLEHPLLQVQRLLRVHLSTSSASLRGDGSAVRGVAYLHNAADLDVDDLFDLATTERTRLFTKSRRGAFLEYLRDQFAPDRGAGAADRLLSSAVARPSSSCRLAADEIKDREQFVLLAEQRLAYEMVLHAVEKAQQSDAKEVVIVTGGPGSGKSVIALSLLGELYRQGHPPCTRPAPDPSRRRCGATWARARPGQEPVQVLQQLHGRRARTTWTC